MVERISSLTVGASLDPSRYEAGARAVTAANRDMTTSGQQAAAGIQATERVMVGTSGGYQNLRRQIGDTTLELQRYLNQVSQINRLGDTGRLKDPISGQLLQGDQALQERYRLLNLAGAAHQSYATKAVTAEAEVAAGFEISRREALQFGHELLTGGIATMPLTLARIAASAAGVEGAGVLMATAWAAPIAAFAAAEARLEANNQVALRFDTTLKGLGSSLTVTGEQARAFADNLSKTGPFSESSLEGGAAALLRVPGLSNADFEQALGLSKDLAAVWGKDVPEAAGVMASALSGNFQAVQQLDEIIGGRLTVDQLTAIRNFDATGDRASAARVLLAALSQDIGGLGNRMTPFATSLKDLGNSWREFLDSLADSGAISAAGTTLEALAWAMRHVHDAAQLAMNPTAYFFNKAAQQQAQAAQVQQQIAAQIAGAGVAGGAGAPTGQTAEDLNRERKEADALMRSLDPLIAEKERLKAAADTLSKAIKDNVGDLAAEQQALNGVTAEATRLLTPLQRSAEQLNLARAAAAKPANQRESFLAGEQARLGALDSRDPAAAAHAEEIGRNAAAAASQRQAEASSDRTAQLRLETAATVQVAQAYLQGSTQGLHADAERQASLERLTNAYVNVAARTRELVNLQAAQEVSRAGPEVQNYERSAAAQERVAAAAKISGAAQHDAEVENRVLAATYQLVAIAADQTVSAQTRAAAALEAQRIGAAVRAQDEAQVSTAIETEIRMRGEEVRLEQQVVAAASQGTPQRAEALALMRATLDLERQFPGATQEQIAQLAQENEQYAKLVGQVKEAQAAQKELSSAIKTGVQDLASTFTGLLTQHKTWSQILSEIDQKLLKIGTDYFFNKPLEKMLDQLTSGNGGLSKLFGGGGRAGGGDLLSSLWNWITGSGGGASALSASALASTTSHITAEQAFQNTIGAGAGDASSTAATTQLTTAATTLTTGSTTLETAATQLTSAATALQSAATALQNAASSGGGGGGGGGGGLGGLGGAGDLFGGGAGAGAAAGDLGAASISTDAVYGAAIVAVAKGAAFDRGRVIRRFAGGTVVDRPTLFGMADGALGLMGEAGREGVMPLTTNSAGQLSVHAVGGGGMQTSLTQNFYGSGHDQATMDRARRTGRQWLDDISRSSRRGFLR